MRLQQEAEEEDPKPHPTDPGKITFQMHRTLEIKSDTAARLRKLRDARL